MPVDRNDPQPGAPDGVDALLARAGGADARAERRLTAAADDLTRAEDGRLDDQLRAVIWATLGRLVDAIERDIRHPVDRSPAGMGDSLMPSDTLIDRVVGAGLFDDRGLLDELVVRAWTDVISAALPTMAPEVSDRASLLPRLAAGPDRVAAFAATAMMAADARRRAGGDDAGRNDLPAELHHRLVWWVAAALRGQESTDATDHALVEAARRALSVHDEGARLEAAAMRLAAALDPSPGEIGEVLEEALADRRLALFAALLAHALGLDPDIARAIALDPDGARLWLALRALDVPRGAVATIGLTLCEADRRRDAEAFAETIETIMAVTPDAAKAALAELKLPSDYRTARHALGRRQ